METILQTRLQDGNIWESLSSMMGIRGNLFQQKQSNSKEFFFMIVGTAHMSSDKKGNLYIYIYHKIQAPTLLYLLGGGFKHLLFFALIIPDPIWLYNIFQMGGSTKNASIAIKFEILLKHCSDFQ